MFCGDFVVLCTTGPPYVIVLVNDINPENDDNNITVLTERLLRA